VATCIWLIGGTSDSRWLANNLLKAGYTCWVTVTTDEACTLYPPHPRLICHGERLTPDTARQLVQQQQVQAIVDASHPFATAISTLAMGLSRDLHLPYLRFERPDYSLERPNCIDVETLIQSHSLVGERVLLTIGSQLLAAFAPLQKSATLFARILPTPTALNLALEAGFARQQLVAIFPPVSRELERALWQHWQITTVVTKASGTESEQIKQELAQELGVTLITLQRPAIAYPQQTADWAGVVAFLEQLA
jgi:precorrin-6A/cobalt-precorrin-6A reductase